MKSRLTAWGALAPLAAVAALAALSGCGGGPSAADAGTPAPTPVTVTVDPTTKYQVMVGFGAAAAYFANYPSIHPSSAAIYQTLFNDLGLEVLRIGNWYGNGNDNGASLEAAATLVAGATTTLGHTPIILMSSWNPSIALKSNGIDDDGGTLVRAADGGYDYAGFGQWWSVGLAAYAAAGVVPDYVSIQNEPDFMTTNEGTCLFDPSEDPLIAGYGAALAAVRQAIAATPGQPMPKFVGPETSGIANNEVPTYLTGIASSGQLDDLDVVAHHLYNGGKDALPNTFDASMTGIAQAAGSRPIWMTEYASNNPDMFNTAWLIQSSVTVEGVSTYLYWDLFWPAPAAGSNATPQGLVSIESPGNPSSWQTPQGFFINDVYYAVQHFAKWIDVGWQRIAATSSDGSVLTSAFVSPDGSHLTLVLLNIDGPDCLVTIDPGTGGAAPFTTTAVYRTSGMTERAAPLGPLQAGNTFDLPGLGIATVTFGP